MGQRLNLEIEGKDGILFNCYYHWDGYTSTSLEDASIALDKYLSIKRNNGFELNERNTALSMLLETGASFSKEEHDEYLKFSSDLNNGLEEKKKLFCPNYERSDRVNGLISFTKNGIEETRAWEETRVVINIFYEQIDLFDLFIDFDEYDYEELEKIKFIDLGKIDLEHVDIDFFYKLKKLLCDYIEKGEYFYKINGNKYTVIE